MSYKECKAREYKNVYICHENNISFQSLFFRDIRIFSIKSSSVDILSIKRLKIDCSFEKVLVHNPSLAVFVSSFECNL